MILSDREIRAARARGAIRLTPEPLPVAWSSTAVDLTLDAQLSVWGPGAGPALPRFSTTGPWGRGEFSNLSPHVQRERPLHEPSVNVSTRLLARSTVALPVDPSRVISTSNGPR